MFITLRVSYITFICNKRTSYSCIFRQKLRKTVFSGFFPKSPPLKQQWKRFGINKGMLYTWCYPLKQIPHTHFINWHNNFLQVQFQSARFITVFDEFGPILKTWYEIGNNLEKPWPQEKSLTSCTLSNCSVKFELVKYIWLKVKTCPIYQERPCSFRLRKLIYTTIIAVL